MKVATCTTDYNFSSNNMLIKTFNKGKSYIMSDMLMNDIVMRSGINTLFASIRDLDSSIYKKYKGEDLNDKKIVIWRTGGMGDLCFITPYLKKIKELYPRSYIIFGCAIQYSDVMKDHPCVDKFEVLPISTDILIEADYHLMFEGIIESNSRAEKINAYDLFGEYFCINLSDEEKHPFLTVNQENLSFFKKIEKQYIDVNDPKGKIKVGIHLKTSSIIRDVPGDLWSDIVNELLLLDERICLYFIGSMDDLKVMNSMALLKNSIKRIVPFCAHTRGFRDSVALISEMDCVIGGDSSGVHIAAAFKKPIVALYGAFHPDVRLRYYENTFGLHSKIKCSPCFMHGSNSCDYSDFNGISHCMRIFDAKSVVEKLSVLLIIKNLISVSSVSPKAGTQALSLYKEFGKNSLLKI